jgi:hypothetical protein
VELAVIQQQAQHLVEQVNIYVLEHVLHVQLIHIVAVEQRLHAHIVHQAQQVLLDHLHTLIVK